MKHLLWLDIHSTSGCVTLQYNISNTLMLPLVLLQITSVRWQKIPTSKIWTWWSWHSPFALIDAWLLGTDHVNIQIHGGTRTNRPNWYSLCSTKLITSTKLQATSQWPNLITNILHSPGLGEPIASKCIIMGFANWWSTNNTKNTKKIVFLECHLSIGKIFRDMWIEEIIIKHMSTKTKHMVY